MVVGERRFGVISQWQSWCPHSTTYMYMVLSQLFSLPHLPFHFWLRLRLDVAHPRPLYILLACLP
jgi:hypothetical protein